MIARRISQAVFWAIFVVFLALPTQWPISELFFRIDFIASWIPALAARVLFASLALTAILVVLTLWKGRVFCGWACPLGSTLDALNWLVKVPARFRGARAVKYHLALFLFGAAALGAAVGYLLDPIVWASRINMMFAFGRVDVPALVVVGGLVLLVHLVVGKRFFCRVLCPLGALLGVLTKRGAQIERTADGCTNCGRCADVCSIGAGGPKPEDYDPAECIQCRECTSVCPAGALEIKRRVSPRLQDLFDAPRRRYLASLGVGLASGLLFQRLGEGTSEAAALRPPGAHKEPTFSRLCIRCGACVRACPSGTLKPCTDEMGPASFQTPILVARQGGCEYDCNACGSVCPTGAIQDLPLEKKQTWKVGKAKIDLQKCRVSREKTPCLVCYAACPVFAIKLVKTKYRTASGDPILMPVVNEDLCTGCGLCEYRCPVSGEAAIRIEG